MPISGKGQGGGINLSTLLADAVPQELFSTGSCVMNTALLDCRPQPWCKCRMRCLGMAPAPSSLRECCSDSDTERHCTHFF